MTKPTSDSSEFAALSSLYTDIDLEGEGKACGFLRVPHSVHRSAYGYIPIPIVRIKNGTGPGWCWLRGIMATNGKASWRWAS